MIDFNIEFEPREFKAMLLLFSACTDLLRTILITVMSYLLGPSYVSCPVLKELYVLPHLHFTTTYETHLLLCSFHKQKLSLAR